MIKVLLFLFFIFSICLNAQRNEFPLTKAELTAFDSTSTTAEVNIFLNQLSRLSDQVQVRPYFKTEQGRLSQYVILSKSSVKNKKEADELGLLVIYMQANIHGGEVEGKEALMSLARDIVLDSTNSLLDSLVILIAPNYNPDGNDKMSISNRYSQEESPRFVGSRRSGQDFDLNRDGMKAEATETRALLKEIIKVWDPAVFVDFHTTNGTWHANQLTYAPSYHTVGDPSTYLYTKERMLPSIKNIMAEAHGISIAPYGNYSLENGWPPTDYYTYNHHPRYLVNQFGLRNRIGILSETFAHDKFYQRIRSAYFFAKEILNYCFRNKYVIQRLIYQSDQNAIYDENYKYASVQKGVRFDMISDTFPFVLRTYDYYLMPNKNRSKDPLRLANVLTLKNVNYHALFSPATSSSIPNGYIIPSKFQTVIDLLKLHGLLMEQLVEDRRFEGEQFNIDSLQVSTYLFEHHNAVQLEGYFSKATYQAKKGDYILRMNQPLSHLAFYLLEPQSDDGLVNWNFFDKYFYQSKVNKKQVIYPVFKFDDQ